MLKRCAVFAAMAAVGFVVCASSLHARELSFEDRVKSQTAIEQVYWNHRIWPKENKTPKPPLSAVLADSQIRARVTDYLKKSNALAEIWSRPITAPQLQAEMERMAAQTKAPDVLRELFAALNNDPFLIAETLARQTLADRLIHNWYASDERFHGDVRRKAEAALANVTTAAQLKSLGAEYTELTWKPKRVDDAPSPEKTNEIALDATEWQAKLEHLPTTTVGTLQEEEGSFVATAVLRRGDDAVTTATVSWPKATFDRWWADRRAKASISLTPSPWEFTPLAVTLTSSCVPDAWSETSGSEAAPDARYGHAAVWTGSEMIVWGGRGIGGQRRNNGGRYNPSTDNWVTTAIAGTPGTAGAPAARQQATAVWTGSEMIVWGGSDDAGGYLNSGGRYSPSTDTWLNTNDSPGNGAPSPRLGHTAVWTGSEMIVWGGIFSGGFLNSGGRYNPSTDTWMDTGGSPIGAPVPRYSHVAVWTGGEMIVWGGFGIDVDGGVGYLNSGGRYNPSTDSWLETSIAGTPGTAGAPTPRVSHTAVWTGDQMIVWGGANGSGYLDSGGRYFPSTDTWLNTNNSPGHGAPLPRYVHTAVWTGSEMIVWGGANGANGDLNSGGRYNPGTDTWLNTNDTPGNGAPAPRTGHSAVWTGSEMIVWGGYINVFPITYLNTGGRYDPSTDTWVATGTDFADRARYAHTAVWTGSEMVVWGGYNNYNGYLNSGRRYNPSTDIWMATSIAATPGTAGAPVKRDRHNVVWTGDQMIVWGGYNNSSGYLNSGGRYFPATDTWLNTNDSPGNGAPSPREVPMAVWTGNEMIIWGGDNSNGNLNSGGRYNPSTDGWIATAAEGAPPAREAPTAVWTGNEMIVWGGYGPGGFSNSGWRYKPATNHWANTSDIGAPAGRGFHTAVWTGREMIVWGGQAGTDGTSGFLNSGGRYDPTSDTWIATSGSPVGAPSPRYQHTAVWTGNEMVVWGGNNFYNIETTGGRYDPLGDSWLATQTSGAPTPRVVHTAVWSGTEMIVWGGRLGDALHDGGRYCLASCAAPATWYQDHDGDGFGTTSVTQMACEQPAGFLAVAGDCDDFDGAIHPGAIEICNGKDDDCNGNVDDGGTLLCDDGNACTGTESCSGANGCQAGTPVVCTPSDQCHNLGVCNPSTGICSNPAKANGTICDDLNACTVGDTCQAGVCQPAGLRDLDGDGHADSQCGGDDCNDANGLVWRAPDAVSILRVPTHNPTTTLTWNGQSAVTGPETLYDVVSGALRIPGGPITLSPADCLQSSTATGFTDTRPNPLPGRGYWYLVRARNSCGIATYGTVQRDASIPACPSAQTCTSASQCSGVDNECGHRTCSTSICSYSFTPAGTPTSSQDSGDCHTNQCDGAGNTVIAIDNADVRDDGNQCTDDLCFSGVPSNPPSSFGSACSQSGGVICDGAGSCVTIPQVAGTNPPDGTSSTVNRQLLVGFSEAMNPATLTGQTVAGACFGSIQVSLDDFVSCIAFWSAAAAMSGGNTLASFVAQPGPLVNRTYKIRVTTAAQSALGIPLAATFTLGTGFTFASPTDPGTIIQNESGAAAEADYCAVVFPLTLTIVEHASTGSIYGQFFEAGVTNPAGPSAAVTAQLGYGPPTSNAEYEVEWTWINASFNVQVGNNDEYQASFVTPARREFRYAYRFSLDGGSSWTYCDSTQGDGGAGSNTGLAFEFETLPVLNVTP